MRLKALLSERSVYGAGIVGTANLEQFADDAMNATGRAIFLKQRQPNHSDASTLQLKAMPRRSGNQNSPLSPRLAKYFNQKQDASAEARAEFPSGLGAVGDTEFETNDPPQDDDATPEHREGNRAHDPLEPLDNEDPSGERAGLKQLKLHGRQLPARYSTDNSAIR